MQYTLSLTARMMALVAFCLVMLAVLLFVTGIEIGKRIAPPERAGSTAPAPVYLPAPPPAHEAASAASAVKP